MELLHFENENNVPYMVMETKTQYEETFEVKMISRNELPSLLPMQLRHINNKNMYYYNIAAKQQFVQLFRYTGISWEDLKMICEGISETIKAVNDYMLDLNAISMSPETIYADVSKKRLYFTYYPENADKDDSFEKGLRELFEYILEHFNHELEKEHLIQLYEVYQRIVQRNYDAAKLWEMLNSEPEYLGKGLNEQKDKVGDTSENDFKEAADENVINEKIKIDTVPYEVIGDEKESEHLGLTKLLNIIKILSVFIILLGLSGMLIPDLMIFKISKTESLIFIIGGMFLNLLQSKASSVLPGVIEEKQYKQPFEAEIHKNLKKHNNADKDSILKNRSGADELNNRIAADKDNKLNKRVVTDKDNKLNKRVVTDKDNGLNNGVVTDKDTNLNNRGITDEDKNTAGSKSSVSVGESMSICTYKEADAELNDFYKKSLQEENTILIADYLESIRKKTIRLKYLKEKNTVYEDANCQHEICIDEFPCRIGSMPGLSDVVINSRLISRKHSEISNVGKDYYIKDLDSANGTYVNGVKLDTNELRCITQGDEIGFAGYIYKIEMI